MILEVELEILYTALRSPFGIEVRTSNLNLARSRLYAARKESADAALKHIQIRASRSDPLGSLWLINAPPQETFDADPAS